MQVREWIYRQETSRNQPYSVQVNEKSYELKRGNIGMVEKGRGQYWDGVVHNVCMVHKDSICMHG